MARAAYVGPVAKGGVEGLPLWVEEVPDVTQTGNFKNLRLLLNNLSGKHRGDESSCRWAATVPVGVVSPVQCRKEAAGSQQHRAFREDGTPVIDPLKVVFSDGGHTDGTCRTIQELVAISIRSRETRTSGHTSVAHKHWESPVRRENMQTPPKERPRESLSLSS